MNIQNLVASYRAWKEAEAVYKEEAKKFSALMREKGLDNVCDDNGDKVTLAKRTTFTYPQNVLNLKEKLDLAKARAEKNGTAEPVTSHSIRVNLRKKI